jgi:hypothetical protein
MNLAEKYKQLFEGKVRSNDAVLLKEGGPVFEPGPGDTLQGGGVLNITNVEAVKKGSAFHKSFSAYLTQNIETFENLDRQLSDDVIEQLKGLAAAGPKPEGGLNEWGAPNWNVDADDQAGGDETSMMDDVKDAFWKEMSGEQNEQSLQETVNMWSGFCYWTVVILEELKVVKQIQTDIEAAGGDPLDFKIADIKKDRQIPALPEVTEAAHELAERDSKESNKKLIKNVQDAIDNNKAVTTDHLAPKDKNLKSLTEKGETLIGELKRWLGDKFKALKKNWDKLVTFSQTADKVS